MCVRARVLTHHHEDEIWMIQIKYFLSLVPLTFGPSAESRGLGSPLSAVPMHCCSLSFPKQDVLSEELHKEGNVSGWTVNTIVVVADVQPVLTQHLQADEKRC